MYYSGLCRCVTAVHLAAIMLILSIHPSESVNARIRIGNCGIDIALESRLPHGCRGCPEVYCGDVGCGRERRRKNPNCGGTGGSSGPIRYELKVNCNGGCRGSCGASECERRDSVPCCIDCCSSCERGHCDYQGSSDCHSGSDSYCRSAGTRCNSCGDIGNCNECGGPHSNCGHCDSCCNPPQPHPCFEHCRDTRVFNDQYKYKETFTDCSVSSSYSSSSYYYPHYFGGIVKSCNNNGAYNNECKKKIREPCFSDRHHPLSPIDTCPCDSRC